MSYNSELQLNNTNLQTILNKVNNLPSAGIISLPDLSNPASDTNILAGKEAIDKDGNKITGTMPNNGSISSFMDGINTKTIVIPEGYTSGGVVTLSDEIDNEVVIQTDLITQIGVALENKVASEDIESVEQATPSITVSSSGLITASATQEAGKVEAGTKTATKQLTTKGATTYTPTTSDQTIASGTYCSGVQTIKGDANLKAENIAEGISIFGVNGTHSSGGSSSGGGAVAVDTCNIILNYNTSSMMGLHFVTYTTLSSNGFNIINHNVNFYENDAIILENVVCNTYILVAYEEMITSFDMSSNIIKLDSIYGGQAAFYANSTADGSFITINN